MTDVSSAPERVRRRGWRAIGAAVLLAAVLPIAASPQAALAEPGPVRVQVNAPAVITSVTPASGYVTVAWDPSPSEGVTQYEVGIADASGMDTLGLEYVGPEVRSHNVPVTLDAGNYNAWVCVTSSEGGYCTEFYPFTVAAAPVSAPGQPTNLQLQRQPRSLAVSWAAPATGGAVDAYEVFATNDQTDAKIECGPISDLSCVLDALNYANTYTVTVTAMNDSGGATVASASTRPGPLAPSKPGTPTVTAGDRSLHVAWTEPVSRGDGIGGYLVTAAPGESECVISDPDVGSCDLANLTNGQEYTVRVYAYDKEDVTRVGSDAVTGTPLAAAPPVPPVIPVPPVFPVPPLPAPGAPGAPTGVTAAAGVSSIEASWTPPSNVGAGITRYTVTANPGPATCTTTGTSCVLGAVAGTPYTVTVVAHAADGKVSPASAASLPVIPSAPVAPAAPPATDLTLTTDRGVIDRVPPGDTITVIGTGFAPHSTVTVTIYSTPTHLGTATADANGDFELTVTVPSDLPAGAHTLVAQGVDSSGAPHAMKLAVTVPAADGDSDLPKTGAGIMTMLLSGAVLVVAGVAMVAIGYRPRRLAA
ncbi:titin [Micromonospora pattaloongensis]|uniref:Titin n=1 Tax=Micromonospora pattaloongensis TaxID=405436 RepID=A0A1H3FQS0_9ACTN|nr:fibronectin type III domain-containing protein [Micromonospora pattaloongensis]SDX92479.1 titin [Micromonospora pattaloongensis]